MTDQNIVSCVNGKFIGICKNGVVSFKGIPFAKPPVGELRWREPVPVSASNETFEAFNFAPSPIQTQIDSERASMREQSEDCLYLNVWTDEESISKEKPVMVFIHGGSYGWGGTADPLYDGQNFIEAHRDVVLVTIAYRIGILGFIDFSAVPGGKAYPASGNLGLLDQICALRYIQDNIRSFGGDPTKVTVFGESAGAGSVSLLPLIPAAKGLFQRIIAESGSVALTFSKKECKALTQMLLKAAGAKNMADLKALSTDDIRQINEELNEYNIFPERDDIVLSEHLYEDYQMGMASDVDMMIGTNSDEMKYWIADLGSLQKYYFMCDYLFENNMKRVKEEDMRRVDAFMKLQALRGRFSRAWRITELYNELLFRLPAIRQADFHSASGGRTYVYYWKYPSGIPRLGACHAVELAYVFNNLDETIYAGDNIDPELAKTVQQMWVNFAKTGSPTIRGELKWERYNDKKRPTMVIDKECHMDEDIKPLQRELLDPLLDYGFNGNYSELTSRVPIVYKVIAGSAAFAILVGVTGYKLYKYIKGKGKNRNKEKK